MNFFSFCSDVDEAADDDDDEKYEIRIQSKATMLYIFINKKTIQFDFSVPSN